jgi:hypothetical protein
MARQHYWHYQDAYDVDWQREAQKWNYIVGNDSEWYRYAIHNIVDETEPLYHDEEEAWRGLYEHLLSIDAPLDYLPTYEELSWRKQKN